MQKLTLEDIEAKIAKEEDWKLGRKTTCVMLTLRNGFEITATSSCVDPTNYDHEIGKSIARRRALDIVWQLEGYLLQEREGDLK